MSDSADKEPAPWRTFLPLGLWVAGILAVLRSAALYGLGLSEAGPLSVEFVRWDVLGRFHERLIEAGIVGILGSVLAFGAARSMRSVAPFTLILTGVLFVAYLSGWPAAPAAERTTFGAGFTLSNAGVQGLIGGLLAVGLFLIAHRVDRAGTPLLVGTVAAIVAALLAVLAPTLVSLRAGAAPTFPVRTVVLDLVAQPGSWKAIESHPDAPPRADVLTPAVSAHTDSADKPALLMAPPCTIEFTVPGTESVRLASAAGIDMKVTNRLGRHALESLTVEFAVTVNGEVRWEEALTTTAPAAGTWDPSEWIWHHAGGVDGLELEPGDVVQLSTHLPEGDPAQALPADFLRVGFGGVVLERIDRRARARATADKPNIVLIVMDTQRADRLSSYGYARETTPNLDRLAERGMRFENAYSTSSWTWPSTASILTGLPPDAHGVVSNQACTLNFDQLTLPEVLQWRGYSTAAFSCNPLIVPQRQFDQGFETFDYHPTDFRMSDEVVPAIEAWLDTHAAARFFLYLHLADPHTPHSPDPRFLEQFEAQRPEDWPDKGLDFLHPDPTRLRGGVTEATWRYANDLYDASVATGDLFVGRVLSRLERLGLSDRTIVLFTSDHGEELLERGNTGHGHSLHTELVHVPLIIAGPGVPPGVTVSSVLSNRHIAPTLARLGGTVMEGMGDGRFLLDYTGEETAEEGSAFFQTVKGKWGELGTQWKSATLYGQRTGGQVLHWSSTPGSEPRVRLYDVFIDPAEVDDRAPGDPAAWVEPLAELEAKLDEQRKYAPLYVTGSGPSGMEVLRGVGYVGKADGDDDEENGASRDPQRDSGEDALEEAREDE